MNCLLCFLVALVLCGVQPVVAQKKSPKKSTTPVQTAPQTSPQAVSSAAVNPEWNKPLPTDPTVKIGKLDNGLTYYIRTNKKPEKRAEINLIVNTGSMMEDADQLGLAHFTEHMCFNGTKNFKKQELVNYLERMGMRFGPDLNAYTSFDETVYLLQIPTDSAAIVKNAFQILEDWAHNVSFDSAEVEKERGVVIEEWRLGRGASQRMLNKQLPVIFKNSRYAERLPIGKKEILESFKHSTLTRFYRDWYRPDLMAVVAVGDFDAAQIEALIKEHFSRLQNPAKPRPREVYGVPDHKETLVSVATDAEAPMTIVQMFVKLPLRSEKLVANYRQRIVESLYNEMLSARLQELTQKPNPPFSFASSGKGRFVRAKEVYFLGAFFVKDNDVTRALDVLAVESERVRKFGFAASELERQKTSLLRRMEQSFAEREKTESKSFAREYTNHFLQQEPILGIAAEYELYKQLLPTITLNEVNALKAMMQGEQNRVVIAQMPKKDSIRVPADQELRDALAAAVKREMTAYEDKASNEPLLEKEPSPVRVNTTNELASIGAVEWKFRNGIRVIAKPTDFKNDEIVFTSYSSGGLSLVSDAEYASARFAASIIDQSGLGKFDNIALGKRLTGTIANATPYISDYYEGVSGSCSPKDAETAFQLVHGYFTAPRRDSAAFVAFKQRIQSFLENRRNSPEAAFSDTVQVTVDNYHPRRKPLSMNDIAAIDLEKAMAAYKDRFIDASDMTFIIVGAFTLDELRPLVEKYIGSLPITSPRRQETWKDMGIRPPVGAVEKAVKRGSEPKSLVHLSLTGDFVWSTSENLALEALEQVMEIRLREVLREDMGGVYGVGVSGAGQRIPTQSYVFLVRFGCAPERVDELAKAVQLQMDTLKMKPIGEDYITKVKEIRRREHEIELKDNSYWMNGIQSALTNNGGVFTNITERKERTELITAQMVQQAAQKYFTTKNMVKVVLYPETQTEKKPTGGK
jgi:zinc protease